MLLSEASLSELPISDQGQIFVIKLQSTRFINPNFFIGNVLLSYIFVDNKFTNTNTFGSDLLSYVFLEHSLNNNNSFGSDAFNVTEVLLSTVYVNSNYFNKLIFYQGNAPQQYGRNIVQRAKLGLNKPDIFTLVGAPAPGYQRYYGIR